jgi:hypothetical protein
MKSKKVIPYISIMLGLLLMALAPLPSTGPEQALPTCSWPLVTTGTGSDNFAYPDTDATYWTMPFDAGAWKTMIITGTFPDARFTSFITYDNGGSIIDSILDFDIKPDQGSRNPFRPGDASLGRGKGKAPGREYTITISRNGGEGKNGNPLGMGGNVIGWIIYRVYVADKGKGRPGGVDLPAVTLVARDGSVHPVPPCSSQDYATAAQALIVSLNASGFTEAAGYLETTMTEGDDGGFGPSDPSICAPQQVAFAIPQDTGGYFPNIGNKYIGASHLCFWGDDWIVVVRGKGVAFPDTYDGAAVWQPPGQFQKTQMRYWSMCNNDQATPYPVVACQADAFTPLDDLGYYTYIVSVDESGLNPPAQPAWVSKTATWLPWGSRQVANVLLLRNMMPASSFSQSIQAALAANCAFNNDQPSISYDIIQKAGQCAQDVMGTYYPVAAYCEKDTYISGGWQACFAAAGINAGSSQVQSRK